MTPRIRPTSQIVLQIDGQGMKRLIEASLAWLRYHQQAINALNVFPVPDGDTGTNMLLTMQSAWSEIRNSPEENIGKMAAMVAHGALMGARGNSGVILSQLWRGFAHALEGKQFLSASDLPIATHAASETAYKGVIKPVEGTILTVSRAIADGAAEAQRDTEELTVILDRMVAYAKTAVANTPNQLEILKQAGVVDSGGQGLAVIIEGMLRFLRGESVKVDAALEAQVDLKVAENVDVDAGDVAQGYSYDVQCIIQGKNLNVEEARARINDLGLSTLVVGDSETIKVHVHVPRPSLVLAYAETIGRVHDVVVEDMAAQYQQFLLGRSSHPVQAPTYNLKPGDIATLAVVPGVGLMHVFQSLGVTAIVPGGQTMNPSTQDFIQLLDAVPTDRALILPNNGNVILAARQAVELSNKQVKVVPTKTVPQGIAALLAFNEQRDLEANASNMEAAAKRVKTGEITTATRSVEFNGVTVEQGQTIGLLNDELTVAGKSIEDAVWQLLEQMQIGELEIVTLYYGHDILKATAEILGEAIRSKYPHLEVEVVEGGQPHYSYIISAE